LDGIAPSEQDEQDYLNFISEILREGIKPKGVLLYTLARPPLQAEAPRLTSLTLLQLEAFAARIRDCGLEVKVSA
jgi:hypothetical protein